MICGLKWKSCECPWFNYDAVEQDRLEHIAGPTSTRQERTRPPARENRRHSSRRTPRSYEEEFPQRASQERDDEDLARQLQYDDDDDDDDNDDDGEYVNGYGEIIGIGNAGGHSMNDDYRRTPRVVPAAPSPPMQAIDRANTGDYVTSVNKKRGVRASSMERRLADRFSEQRQSSSPTHHTYTMPISTPPPPPPPPLGMPGLGMTGMGPPVPLHPPGVPFMRRAHTMEEDMYGGPSHSRLSERITPGRTRREFEADTASHTPPGRRRHRERERQHEIPRDSVLAGLTGPGEGMNRVHEWRNYVTTEDPDFGEIVAH